MFKVPEEHRATLLSEHPLYSKSKEPFGLFWIPYANGIVLYCIVVDGDDEIDWEHVSVSVKKQASNALIHLERCPTWEEMCVVKDHFWEEEDCVVQFHPPKSEYISQHPYCLHLWRKINTNFETPPSIAVGVKK